MGAPLVHTPVTAQRIRKTLHQLGLVSFTDDQGDLGIALANNVVYFLTRPDHPPMACSSWHRELDIRFATEAALEVRNHNANFYIPKLYTVVSDDGKIRFHISHCFNWESGATDAQIEHEIDVLLYSSTALFDQLDSDFPDPWGSETEEDQ